MGKYRDLCLSAGGGIMPMGWMEEQRENTANICIGLGGTGVSCLRNLKRQVYARVKPDHPEASVPKYRHIKFLAVDSDRASLGGDGKINDLDEDTEFFDISTSNIQAIVSNRDAMDTRPEFQWLRTATDKKSGISILAATAGAGGVRQIGRCLLMLKSSKFMSRIENLIQDVRSGLPEEHGLNIHIFSGMGGGTGSGTFLDVCYLVRRALNTMGEAGHALVFGYFFLPDVNLSMPAVRANEPVDKFIRANGFAAMKELDYCMNFEHNGGEWNQQYQEFHITSRKPPVDICHLISATSVGGTVKEHGFVYALNAVSDFVMQFLVKSDSTMESDPANYVTAIRLLEKEQYCALGVSNVVVPMREITTYLASKLFERLSHSFGNLPTNEQISNFAKENKFTYEQLLKEILWGTDYRMRPVELDYKLYTDMSEEDLGMDALRVPETIGLLFDRQREEMENKVAANKTAMTQEWSWKVLAEDKRGSSVTCRVFDALSRLVCDDKYGPLYAAAVLNGEIRTNLVALMEGIRAQAQEERENVEKSMSLRMEEVKKARSAFLHPGIFGNKAKLFDEFMGRVQRYWTDEAHIAVLARLEGAAEELKKQLRNMYSECFAKYASVTKNLAETFYENYQILTKGAWEERKFDDPYEVLLIQIEDIKASLNQTVEAMDLAQAADDFHSALFLDNAEVWNKNEERRIVKFVSEYMVNKFSGYTDKTLEEYLMLYFGLNIEKERDEMLKLLSRKAEPLFWPRPGYTGKKNYSILSGPEMMRMGLPGLEEIGTMRDPAKQGCYVPIYYGRNLRHTINFIRTTGASIEDYALYEKCRTVFEKMHISLNITMEHDEGKDEKL